MTAREFQILKAVAAGGGFKGAARKFNLSVKTIEAHFSNMRGKAAVTSTLDLILAALRANLITLDDLPAPSAGEFTPLTVRQDEAAAA